MFFKSLINFLIILLCLFKTSNCDIENCSFINTVNITTLKPYANNTYLYNNIEIPINLVDDYNYDILKNGLKIEVNPHKRGCICLDPCIRFCSNSSLEFYRDDDEINDGYTKYIRLQNGSDMEKHLIFDFNHRIDKIADCDEPYFLVPTDNPNENWTLFENLTLLRNDINIYFNQDQYCFHIHLFEDKNETYFYINPMICAVKRKVPFHIKIKSIAMALSTPFFVLTIIVYCLLPQSRNHHGKCFIMYLIFLALSYLLLCIVALSERGFEYIPCLILGYTIYFTTIAFLTWISIISYDTWKTLTRFVVRSSFRKYLFFGFMIPALATLLTFVAQKYLKPDELKPDIQKHSCGVNTKRRSAFIYYYLPFIIVLSYSLSKYITVLRYIHKNETSEARASIKKSHKERFFIYFRLLIFMGVTWVLDILSYFLQDKVNNIMYVADLLTALNGVFVFITFICRRSVIQKLKKRFSHANKSVDIDVTNEMGTL